MNAAAKQEQPGTVQGHPSSGSGDVGAPDRSQHAASPLATALAALLNGREYRKELQGNEGSEAKAAGLVIVYGASDDLMEFEGAIADELGAYEGTTAYLTRDGLLTNECENEDCPHFEKLKAKAATIEALFGEGEYTWTYKTDIPHATFEVVEDGEPYCRGIVFALADVKDAAQ